MGGAAADDISYLKNWRNGIKNSADQNTKICAYEEKSGKKLGGAKSNHSPFP
jgi:hypothetical protein